MYNNIDMTIDLTKGSPVKKILVVMLPIFIGNVFQQLYNMVDTFIVGRTINSAALAGVGATGPISFLIIGFVSGLTTGFAVMTSQCFGAKNFEDVKRSVGTSLSLSMLATVVLTLVSALTARPLLQLMQTPPDLIDYAYDYIVIIFWGLGATVFYNIVSNIVRALGDSVTPLVFLILASAINVGLDFWFIVGLKMGVAGAGLATVVSQLLSAVACLVYMFLRYPVLRIHAKHLKLGWNWSVRHLVIGLPMAFQFSITAVGVMVQQAALNTLGTPAVTAYTAASKIDNLATQSMFALGATMATYCGQNYGAGEYGRIKKGVNGGLLLSAVFTAIGAVFAVFTAKPLTVFFIPDATAEILGYAQVFLNYQAIFYIFLAVLLVYRNSLQGMSRSGITVIAGVIELAMRVAVAFSLVKFWGFTGLSLSNPIAWVGAVIFLVITYYTVIRKYRNAGAGVAKNAAL